MGNRRNAHNKGPAQMPRGFPRGIPPHIKLIGGDEKPAVDPTAGRYEYYACMFVQYPGEMPIARDMQINSLAPIGAAADIRQFCAEQAPRMQKLDKRDVTPTVVVLSIEYMRFIPQEVLDQAVAVQAERDKKIVELKEAETALEGALTDPAAKPAYAKVVHAHRIELGLAPYGPKMDETERYAGAYVCASCGAYAPAAPTLVVQEAATFASPDGWIVVDDGRSLCPEHNDIDVIFGTDAK